MWEYKALSAKDMRTDDSGGPLTVQQRLDALGKDEWELVAFQAEGLWVFKRQAESARAKAAKSIEDEHAAEQARLARKDRDSAPWKPPVF